MEGLVCTACGKPHMYDPAIDERPDNCDCGGPLREAPELSIDVGSER